MSLTSTLSKILQRIVVKGQYIHLQDRNLYQQNSAMGTVSRTNISAFPTHFTKHYNTYKLSCIVLLIWKKLLTKHCPQDSHFHLPIAYIRFFYNFITERLTNIVITLALLLSFYIQEFHRNQCSPHCYTVQIYYLCQHLFTVINTQMTHPFGWVWHKFAHQENSRFPHKF